ncbi:hypothetical protein WN944_003525 [Citrus x changshan-huyou]|uniref:RNase H type-1 domain-containing protein n=1 Tax=Citrus x changshan-huyou TaxID=2935761 RepID=A0AAP0M1K3_9ROSI
MFVIALLIVNMQGISGSLSLAFHGLKVQFICHSLALLRKKLNKLRRCCMAAAATKKPCLGDVKTPEALAVLEGVKMAAEAGLSPLIIESNSKNVARFYLNGISSRKELDWIISG